eukprot:SAG11_NODE_40_length_21525_cov_16.276066_10_plen_100_part_00
MHFSHRCLDLSFGAVPQAGDPINWNAAAGRSSDQSEVGEVGAVRPVLLSAGKGNLLCSLARDGVWAEALLVLRAAPSAAAYSRRGFQVSHKLLSSFVRT